MVRLGNHLGRSRVVTPSFEELDMFKTVVLVAFLVLAAGPAFAQAGSTQSPPAPNAASAGPEPTNSLPPGAAGARVCGARRRGLGGQLHFQCY